MALLGSTNPYSEDPSVVPGGPAYGVNQSGPSDAVPAQFMRTAYQAPAGGADSIGLSLQSLYNPGFDPAASTGGSYQGYLASARSRITNELNNALGDINASEMRGASAIGTLPGQYQNIYGSGLQQIDQNVAASKAAQAKTGLQSFTPAGAGAEPVKAAIQGAQSDRNADVPLLQLGNQQMAAMARGRANVNAMDMQNQLDQQGAGYAAQNDLAQQAFLRNAYLAGQSLQAQEAMAQQQHEWGVPLQNAQIAEMQGLGNYYANAGQANATPTPQQTAQTYLEANPAGSGAKYGQEAAVANPDQAKAVTGGAEGKMYRSLPSYAKTAYLNRLKQTGRGNDASILQYYYG